MNLSVTLGRIRFRNPILVASGTFGYAKEMAGLVDFSKLGGIVPKTVTQQPRAGNAPPRTVETSAGMLNAIGTPLPAATSQSSDQAAATASNPGHGLRFSTNRDLAEQIAVCRAAHAELADQLNAILDIEEARHAQKP